jgi:hypothetical protein
MVGRPPLAFLLVTACALLASCGSACGGGVVAPSAPPASVSPAITVADATVSAPLAPSPAGQVQILVEGQAYSANNELEAVREHAAAFLPCPKDRTVARSVLLGRQGSASSCTPSSPSCWTFADGCGQRVVYGTYMPSQGGPFEYYVVSRVVMGHAGGGR